MDEIQKSLLEKIADIHEVPEGAYNIRSNGQLEGRNTTANIDIVTKKDEPGIDIIIKPGTKNEGNTGIFQKYQIIQRSANSIKC